MGSFQQVGDRRAGAVELRGSERRPALRAAAATLVQRTNRRVLLGQRKANRHQTHQATPCTSAN
jgi:hypothetical protein